MAQYQSPINALLSQLPQLAMQMYGASREDKYRAETASREDKYRDKEMQFQKNNAAFSQGIQNRNADIAEDNAEQARLSAIAQRNLYAEQLLVAKQTREANDPNTVMFENENSSSPIGIMLNQGTKNYDNFTKPVYSALLNGAKDRGFKNPEVIAQLGLLQGALESDYGNSAPGNNIFGIKSATGTSRDTKEFVNGKEVSVKQNFGDYATPADSVDSYLDLIQNSKYYGGIRDARTIGDAIASTGKYADDPEYQTKLAAMNDSLFTGSQYAPGTSLSPLQELMDANLDGKLTRGEMNNYKSMQAIKAENAQIDASESAMNLANSKNTEYLNTADNRKRLTELDIESKETANEQNKINLAVGKFQRDSLLARGALNNVIIPGVQPWYGDVRAAPDPKKIGKKEGRLLNPIEAIKFVFNKKDTNIQPIVELYRNKDEVINQWVSASKNSGLSESLIRDSAEEKWNEMASGIVDRISVQILSYDGEKAQADFLDRIEKAGLSFKRGDAALSGGNQFGNQVQMPQRPQY